MGVKRFGLVQRPSKVIPTPETCVPKAWRWQKFCPFCGSMRCHRTIGTLLIKTGLRGEVSEPPHLRQRPGEVPSRSLHQGSPQTCTATCHQVTTRPGAWQWPQEGELSVQGMWHGFPPVSFCQANSLPSLCFSISILPSSLAWNIEVDRKSRSTCGRAASAVEMLLTLRGTPIVDCRRL